MLKMLFRVIEAYKNITFIELFPLFWAVTKKKRNDCNKTLKYPEYRNLSPFYLRF